MRELSAAGNPVPLYLHRAVTLFVGMVIGLSVPIILRFERGRDYFESSTSLYTFAAVIAAILMGFFLARKLDYFAGLSSGSTIILAYCSSFIIVALAFFLSYLEYSRFIYFSAGIAVIPWFLLTHLMRKRYAMLHFSYVPGTPGLEAIDHDIRYTTLTPLKNAQDFSSINGAVVADLRANLSDEWVQFLAECALRGIPVFHIKNIREEITGMVQIEHLSENTLGSILPSSFYLNMKWVMDTLLAVLLIPFIASMMAVVLPLLYITQGRPFFFTQQRIGLGGKPFTMYKLRTMLTDDQLSQRAVSEQRNSAETKNDDPRITRLGRILRKFRIDELPQFINVLKGDMSWIGPRPEAAVLGNHYENVVPFYRYRYIVRPGISGWAQVNQGHVTDVDEISLKLQYDFYYVKNISAWLDILIVLRTIRTVMGGFGAR